MSARSHVTHGCFREELQKMTNNIKDYLYGKEISKEVLEAKLEKVLKIMEDVEAANTGPSNTKEYIMDKFLNSQQDSSVLPTISEARSDTRSDTKPLSVGQIIEKQKQSM